VRATRLKGLTALSPHRICRIVALVSTVEITTKSQATGDRSTAFIVRIAAGPKLSVSITSTAVECTAYQEVPVPSRVAT
jgi:hypothetical protein